MRSAKSVGRRTGPPDEAATDSVLDGRYVLHELLGRGADGETYAAVDRASGDGCAIKLLTAIDPGAESRLRDEFGRLSTLVHRGVLRVRELGRAAGGDHAGRFYLVTDRVSGPPLGTIAAITDESARVATFHRAARDLADALAYVHARGVIHGDVTPSNVRLDVDGRPVLLDFGLSATSTPGRATGTLGFASPEALVGERGPAGDLFGLGATLFASWTGAPPFGLGVEAVRRMLSGRAPDLSSVRGGLDGEWDGVVARLLSIAPEDRFASALELLRVIARLAGGGLASTELDLGAPLPAGDPLAGVIVGRSMERAALAGAIERLAEGSAPGAVVTVSGAPGSGRRAVIEAVLRAARIARAAGALPAFEIYTGPLRELSNLVGVAAVRGPAPDEGDPSRSGLAYFASLADVLETRAASQPLCAVLAEGADAEAFARFVAGGEASGRLLLVLPTSRSLDRPGARDLPLEPLAPTQVVELCRRAVSFIGGEAPSAAVAKIVDAAAGHAGTATVLARRLIDAVREGVADRFSPEGGEDLLELLSSGLAALPPAGRRLVAAVALGVGNPGRTAEIPDVDLDAVLAGVVGAGWMVHDGAAMRLPSETHRAAVVRSLAHVDLRAVARAAASELGEGNPRRGDALVALGDREGAAAVFRVAAVAAGEARDVASETRHLERVRALAREGLSVSERLALTAGLGSLGRYDEALKVLDGAATGALALDLCVAIAERRAWLLGRQGDLRAARTALEGALEETTASHRTDLEAVLRGRLAKLLVAAGQLREALAVAAPVLANGDAAAVPAIEAAALARAYSGQAAEARALLDGLAPRIVDAGRLAYLRGLMDQMEGRFTTAASAYRTSYDHFAAAGDVHGLAATALNLGSVLAAGGRYEEALPVLERAVRELGRLGRTSELGTALFDVGTLLVELGDVDGARRAVTRAREEGRARGAAMVGAYAAYVEADLKRREGQPRVAIPLYAEAAQGLERAGNGVAARAARLARAEALAEAGLPAEAAAALAEVEGEGDEGSADRSAVAAASSEELALAKARVGLAAPALDPAAASRLAGQLVETSLRAYGAGRRLVAWRSALLGARLFDRVGNGDSAAEALLAARRVFEEVRMATPVNHRRGLEANPEARWLTVGRSGDRPESAYAARAESRLRRLLRINKRLNSEQRLSRLLELIVDTVIELTDAERGFILLEEAGGELAVKVARNIDQRTLEASDFELSRSIARQAAQGGEPIVTVDAAGDSRFREAMSVSDLRLRSVLAVPLTVKGRTVGTIYVDHRLRKGAFDGEDVALVLDFAEQAAIAIENARLLAEVRRRERQIDALNRRLETELAARREELTGMRQELRENRDALAVRYDYRNIVGRTPRMLELFRLLDRVTDTSLPAVIQGESGTGKELVARAIHFNGSRREHPFISENCAAIPETLLESTLFGYVRGAFTGADHDAKGLFEIADGGTLFLDEIGEMSAGMQGKLLRVLQEGEFRRVGGERERKVDVRMVAATNRDLARMVEEGKFRQDLYFRLNVVRIALPPLRDRREDIPLIVAHFCVKHGGGNPPKEIDAAAMAKLVAYRWPGNVRELENEVLRSMSMSGARITVGDLSPQVVANGDEGLGDAGDPDSLQVKPRVERLERTLIREALSRTAGNQTKAAAELGLSRFGLQKKLRRYHLVG